MKEERQMVIDGSELSKSSLEEVDYIVVGTGAGGAIAACDLAAAGYEVAVLEEGPLVSPGNFTSDMLGAMQQLYRNGGNTVMTGRSLIPYLQGCAVGGTTIINSAIIWRLPGRVLYEWEKLYGIGGVFREKELDEVYDSIEKELSVRPVDPAIAGNANRLLREGCESLGLEGRIILRNEEGCTGSGLCGQGCPSGAKKSTDVTYIPLGLEKGMRLYTSSRVDKVTVRNGRAAGVTASPVPAAAGFRAGKRERPVIEVKARRGVLLAASAVQTPLILRASGLKGRPGDNFQAHPGAAPVGLFDEPVEMWRGATQGYECTHFHENPGFKMEVVNLPAELGMVRIPGVGRGFMNNLRDYRHAVIAGVQVRARARGKVRKLPFGPFVRYTPASFDMERIRSGIRIIAEIMFAAGAKKVLPGIHGLPKAIGRDELDLLNGASIDPRAYLVIATHLFSTAPMGPNPESSVTGTDFQVHELPGCYIVDSSVFPANTGCNPQHFIMAAARIAVRRIIESN